MSLNDYMKNLNYRIKAKEIGESSWGSTRPKHKPMTMPTVDNLLTSGVQLNKQQNLRNEMVAKYMKEQESPAQITIDGEVRDFKFHQVERPELEDYEQIDAQKRELAGRRGEIDVELNRIRDEAQEQEYDIDDTINNLKMDIVFREDDKRQVIEILGEIAGRITDITAQPYSRMSAEHLNQMLYYRNSYEEEYRNLDRQIDDIRRRILDAERQKTYVKDGLDQRRRLYEGDINDLNEFEARIQNTEKQNKDKIKNYEQELISLNVGKLSTTQNPDESDEAYYERLIRLADMPFADGETEEKARIEQKKQLRENLISITRNQELINQVVNAMDFENYLDIFALNKIFLVFKDRFLKVYGPNNKNITAQDIIDFAEKTIENPERPVRSVQAEGFADYNFVENDDGDKEALILYTPTGDEFYFKYLEGTHRFMIDEDRRISKRDLLFYSVTGEEGSFKNINTPLTLKEILLNIGAKSLEQLGLNTQSTKKQFIEKMKGLQILPVDPRVADYAGDEPEGINGTYQHIIGVGLNSDPKDIPNKVVFGDKVIDLKKLYLKNILSLTTNTGLKIHGIKNAPVSDGFVKVIFDIINGKDLLSKDLGGLHTNEKVLLDTVLTASGLHKKHNTGGKVHSISKIKKDYEIVIGEIESGNNGSEIKRKLYELLHTLANLGSISKGQAIKQYKDIVKNYF